MADPVIVACPANTWTIVATNVTTGQIFLKTGKNLSWNHNYRDTGGAAPTDDTEAVKFQKPVERIESPIGIDVYVYPVAGAGTVVAALV